MFQECSKTYSGHASSLQWFLVTGEIIFQIMTFDILFQQTKKRCEYVALTGLLMLP